ncbi:MAG: LTA synthase family protein [Rikenellaceae bacterium]
MLYQWNQTIELEALDFVRIFGNGLQHDLSLGGYVMLLASVVLAISSFVPTKYVRYTFNVITIALLVFYSAVFTFNLELFSNWGYHIDTSPLKYLLTPKEMFASSSFFMLTLGALVYSSMIILPYILYSRFVIKKLDYKVIDIKSLPIFLLLGGVMIIPVRGGFNVAPMNASFVFFHPTNMYANQAAVNPVWNFVYELAHIKDGSKVLSFMDEEKAKSIIKEVNIERDSFPTILNTQEPNIVLLLLESFSAQAIEVLGGKPGVTPNLNALAKEGVLFSNIYATSSRSDRGLVAAISGLPANPYYAFIDSPAKLMKYPSFPKTMEEKGYSTRFYYAGDLNFGNFSSYTRMNFQDVVTEDDFSGEAIKNRFKWGVHDEYMFERLYDDISEAPQPFMYMAFNMSSHEPFDVPLKSEFYDNDNESKFLNSIHYSDVQIGKFIDNCKSSGIWDNTLFILMADHSTKNIGGLESYDSEAFHIPLLLTGGAVAVQDTVITTIGSQTDMVATVFAQLGLDASSYEYSRNLLNDGAKGFAFYSYSNDAGVVSDEGISIYNLKMNSFIKGDDLEQNKLRCKAFIQEITNEFRR